MLIVLFLFSRNLMSIFIFYESLMLPMLAMIMGDRYQYERVRAGFYLVIYMIFFTYPSIYVLLGSKAMFRFYLMKFIYLTNYIYLFVRLVFLIKIALFMFHYWLIKVHVEVSIKLSVLLSSIMLKVGGFSLSRFVLSLVKFVYFDSLFIYLGVAGRLIFRMLVFNVLDIKVLIAVSSIIYMNLGILIFYLSLSMGKSGFMMIIYHHRFRSIGIFILAGLVNGLTVNRNIYIKAGFVNGIFGLLFILILMSLNFPLIVGFLGEVSLFMGLYKFRLFVFILVGLIFFVILFYNLWIFWGLSGFSYMYKYSGYLISLKVYLFFGLLFLKIRFMILIRIIFNCLFNLSKNINL